MRSWLGWATRATCTPRGRSLSAKGTTAVASTLNSLMHHSLRSPQEKSTISASLPMFVIWNRYEPWLCAKSGGAGPVQCGGLPPGAQVPGGAAMYLTGAV